MYLKQISDLFKFQDLSLSAQFRAKSGTPGPDPNHTGEVIMCKLGGFSGRCHQYFRSGSHSAVSDWPTDVQLKINLPHSFKNKHQHTGNQNS